MAEEAEVVSHFCNGENKKSMSTTLLNFYFDSFRNGSNETAEQDFKKRYIVIEEIFDNALDDDETSVKDLFTYFFFEQWNWSGENKETIAPKLCMMYVRDLMFRLQDPSEELMSYIVNYVMQMSFCFERKKHIEDGNIGMCNRFVEDYSAKIYIGEVRNGNDYMKSPWENAYYVKIIDPKREVICPYHYVS